jgi:hypothetical protein
LGAFRVVQVDDLRDVLEAGRDGSAAGKRVRDFQESGLLRRIPQDARDRDVLVLTDRGRDILETHRLERADELRQAFHASLRKPRELSHDVQVYCGQTKPQAAKCRFANARPDPDFR